LGVGVGVRVGVDVGVWVGVEVLVGLGVNVGVLSKVAVEVGSVCELDEQPVRIVSVSVTITIIFFISPPNFENKNDWQKNLLIS